MKRRVRLLVAAATGAAVLAGGAGLTTTAALAAQQQVLAADDFNGAPSVSNAGVPLEQAVEATITLKLREPGKVTALSGAITPAGKTEQRAVTFDFKADSTSTATETTVTGKWTIGKDDPSGEWKLVVNVTRDGSSRANEFAVAVSGKQGITSGTVTPDPVQLVKGEDVKVTVTASVKDATMVTAKLVSDTAGEYYDLGELAKESDGYYRGVTYFSDDSTPGSWTLELYASRGGQTLKGEASFTVVAPEGGASKKARAKVTINAPSKVRAGKTFKVYGKAYRGTRAYPSKVLEVYFKAKGTKTYKFMGFTKTTSTGKYAKSFKARKDGYFQVKVPGTSKTRSALSPQEFVDVR
uniref:hypothetical protein n=1 Tax=Nonomuraea pusilla TaxID=46177 RepID=UPI000ABEBA71|nr:hypothetical protein [Nonomuraea pusilla]